MKKTWLYPCMLASAAMMIASTAHAEPIQIPGIVYIPTEEIELLPSGAAGDPACTGAGTYHSGLNCTPLAMDMAQTVAPFADAATLATDLATALAAWDVMVTNTRPVKYVPFMMMLPSDEVNAKSPSFTCTGGGGPDCSALSRRRIGSSIGGSENCMMPDLVHQHLYLFGRLSGLEGTDPMAMTPGVMSYIPDYTMPQTTFVDECVAIVPDQGFDDRGNQIDILSPCTSLDHTGCDMGEQNSTADLTATYGAPLAAPDETAPVVEITSIKDGAVFMLGEDPLELTLDGTITEDDSAYVGVMWTLSSPAFMENGLDVDTVEFCTNDACNTNPLGNPWDGDAAPVKELGVDSFAVNFSPLAGEYTATLEAADMYGNVSEIATVTFTVEAAPEPGTSGADGSGSASAGDATASGGGFTTGADGGSDGTDGGSSAADGGSGDDGGCSCTTAPEQGGLTLLMFSLFGLGIARRRR